MVLGLGWKSLGGLMSYAKSTFGANKYQFLKSLGWVRMIHWEKNVSQMMKQPCLNTGGKASWGDGMMAGLVMFKHVDIDAYY